MKEYEIVGNVGDEVLVKKGNLSLVVKIGEKELIPDFATVVTNVLLEHPNLYLSALESVWHHSSGAESRLRETVAWDRDRIFASVVVEPPKEEPKTITIEGGKKNKKQAN